MELCLVAKLGLNGVCSIKLATKAVPKNHPNRLETIASIANYSLSNKVHSSSIIESVNLADNSDEENLLSRYALSTGHPTTY